MDYLKNFFTTLINICYPDPKKKIVAWRQIILFILIMAIVVTLAVGFCCASENKSKSQRPKLSGNYETGERFAPSLEDFFLPDDEVDDNYSFDDFWLKYTYPLSKETRLNLKQRIAYKDYIQKDNYDSTANYYIFGFSQRFNPALKLNLTTEFQDRDYVNDSQKNYRAAAGGAELYIKPKGSINNYRIGFRLRNKDYIRASHKNVDTASFFLQWRGQLREDLNLKVKYKAYHRHYKEDAAQGKDRFKHSASVGFEYWF